MLSCNGKFIGCDVRYEFMFLALAMLALKQACPTHVAEYWEDTRIIFIAAMEESCTNLCGKYSNFNSIL